MRSFLQFTGKVNKGIRQTILTEPSRFLPYNNGISATASAIELEGVKDGLARLVSVEEFQIVNGGQTTASIASCLRRDHADLANVSVAMKLTVVPAPAISDVVPQISRYANTQNRIQEADFSANHPWHIALEQHSRSTWTSPDIESPRGTRWFYERARGQYADELSAQHTGPGRRKFRTENPSKQKLTKTDVAKFALSWEQEPEIVSRGAQKSFMDFMNRIVREKRRAPDLDEFKRLVALAILFRTAEGLYGDLDYQGYRAQVVTYSVARLSNYLGRMLPWGEIWQRQSVSDEYKNALKLIMVGVRETIIHPPGNRNITEWCKRAECWTTVLSLPISLSLTSTNQGHDTEQTMPVAATASELAKIIKIIPSDVWYGISKWAKSTGSLQPWQRSLAFSLGRISAGQRFPSEKQAVQGAKVIEEAVRLGFRHTFGHPDLTLDMLVTKVRTANTAAEELET